MSVLVINSFAETKDTGRLPVVSSYIGDIVNRARWSNLPIAHLHQKRPMLASGLRVSIGRYEPVFQAFDLSQGIPDGLFDFIVTSPTKSIQLVGAASWKQIKQLSSLLDVAGYAAQVERSAIVETREEA